MLFFFFFFLLDRRESYFWEKPQKMTFFRPLAQGSKNAIFSGLWARLWSGETVQSRPFFCRPCPTRDEKRGSIFDVFLTFFDYFLFFLFNFLFFRCILYFILSFLFWLSRKSPFFFLFFLSLRRLRLSSDSTITNKIVCHPVAPTH